MTCREMRRLIARKGGLTSPETDQVSVHLRDCPACAAIARRDRLTRHLLEALAPDEQPSPYFFARLRARLREGEPPALVWGFWGRVLVPILATLTLVLGGITYLLSPPASPPLVVSLLESRTVTPETLSVLGIPRPTRDQVLASVLEVEERVP